MRALLIALALFAPSAAAEDTEPVESRRLKPDHAPTPYSAGSHDVDAGQ